MNAGTHKSDDVRMIPESSSVSLTGTGVSIIIPCYACPSYLQSLMDSIPIAVAELGEPTEVIVVDTSPIESNDQLVTQRLCKERGALYLHGMWRSVARSRNAGAQQAAYDKLFFVDADCRLRRDTLRQHVLGLMNAGGDTAGGVGLTLLTGPLHLAGRAMKASPFIIGLVWARRLASPPWGTTCNLFVPRDVFIRLGGFDEGFFNVVGGEDVDYGLRAVKGGLAWRAVPSAVVEHASAPWDTWRGNIARVWNYGIGDHYLASVHGDRVLLDPFRYPSFVLCVLAMAIWFVSSGDALSAVMALASLPFAFCFCGIVSKLGAYEQESYPYCVVGEVFVLVFECGHVFSAVMRRDYMNAIFRVKHLDVQRYDILARSTARMLALVAGIFLAAWM